MRPSGPGWPKKDESDSWGRWVCCFFSCWGDEFQPADNGEWWPGESEDNVVFLCAWLEEYCWLLCSTYQTSFNLAFKMLPFKQQTKDNASILSFHLLFWFDSLSVMSISERNIWKWICFRDFSPIPQLFHDSLSSSLSWWWTPFPAFPISSQIPLSLPNYHLLILNESPYTLHDFNTAC